ncbi:MAG: hypothetical protein ACRD4B_04595 [Acidobacteriota bacterium]
MAIAQIISFLFNPVLLFSFVPLFLVYRTTGDITTAMVWTGYTMIFLLIMAFFIIYGVQKQIFTDIDVSNRTQRPLLFIVSFILSFVYLGGLFLLHGPMILSLVIGGIIVGIVLVSIINTRIKASIHVATISALIFALAFVYNGWYLLLLLFIPLVAWARLKVNRHTLQETIVGAALGILLSLGLYFVIKFIYS